MADIRLKKISVENSPLIIQNGNISILNTNISDSILNGALISKGGISINCSHESTSSSSGGAFTVGGGMSIIKDIYIGQNLILDNLSSTIKISGISENRLYFDNITNKQFYISLDGINRTFELNEEGIYLNNNTPSENSTTGALRILGGLTINSTENSTSITSGNGLTVFGGTSIVKKIFIGGGIESNIATNTIGNLYTITNGNIGIGTTNPITQLTITSNIFGSKITLKDDNDTTKHFGFGVSENQMNYDVKTSDDDHVFYSNGKNNENSPNELLRIKGNGNIGINTSIPEYKLDVNGTLHVTNSINFEDMTNTIGNIYMSNGNIGINTTDPQYKLDIDTNDEYLLLNVKWLNDIGSTKTFQITMPVTSGNVNEPVNILSETSLTFNSGKIYINQNGNVGINTTTPSTELELNGSFKITNGSLNVSNSENTVGSIYTKDGDVGIGIVNPLSKLHVFSEKAGGDDFIFETNDLNNSSNIILRGNCDNINDKICKIKFENNNTGNKTIAQINANQSTIDTENADISFEILKQDIMTEILRISGTSGNVGIGTTSPEHKLDIVGDMKVSGDISIGSLNIVSNKIGINNTDPTYILDINTFTRITDILTIEKETPSSNSSTGSLILKNGGISIDCTEDANGYTSGGGITIAGGTSINKKLFVNGNNNVNGILTIENTTQSTNTSSGSLQVLGGASIIKNLNIGQMITSDKLSVINNEISLNSSTGSVIFNGGLSINSNENAISYTSGGAITIAGGVAIKKDIYIEGNEYKKGVSNYYSESNSFIQLFNSSNEKIYSIDRDYFTNTFSISRYNAGTLLEKTIEINLSNGIFTFNNTTSSSSTASSSIIIKGGLSIISTENSINATVGGAFSVYGGQSIAKDLNIGGKLIISNTEQSSDVSTGCMIISGGVGINKNLNVNGNTTINGDLYVNGTTTTIESNNTVLKDNILMLNSAPSGIKDSGIIIARFQEDNDIGFGDIVNEDKYIEFQIPNQSGMTNTEIKLANSANSTNDYYKNWWIKITSGFSDNQVRKIVSYDGNTKIATLSSEWTTQNPAENDIVFLYNRTYVGLVYNEADDIFVFGSTVNNPDTTSVTLIDNVSLKTNEIEISGTKVSSNSSTGSIIIQGGLSINCDQNASNNTVGGSFTVNGGGSIKKDLYVGQELYVNNINFTPNNGDQWKSSIFSANNNQSSQETITGLNLDSNIWGFDIFLTARLNADDDLYTNYHLRGVNKNTSWEIVKTYVGDDIGIEFFITNLGEIQYTTPNYSGFVSLEFKWRMFVN
jgi:hypothetical protein